MGTLLLLQIDPSGWTTLWWILTLPSAAKHQVRETRRSVWETKWMMRAELFLREKDWWHDSAAHMECIFDEMLRSAEHVGIKERNHQHRCWERNGPLPPWAPTTGCVTSFVHLGSRNDHQLIKSLVEECRNPVPWLSQHWAVLAHGQQIDEYVRWGKG